MTAPGRPVSGRARRAVDADPANTLGVPEPPSPYGRSTGVVGIDPAATPRPNVGANGPEGYGGPTTQQPPGQVATEPPAGSATPYTGAGGATYSPINPHADVRGQQIMPGLSAQAQAAQQMVGGAAQAVHQGGYSPFASYQAVAAPYQAAGSQAYDRATASAGAQQGYLDRAGQATQAAGFGSYGAIHPTLAGVSVGAPSVAAQQIGGPTFTQGAVQLPGLQTGPLSPLANLAFAKDTEGLRGRVGHGVSNLYDAPDRQQLALDQFNLLQEQAAPRFAQEQRDLGKSSAAFGRVGSGMVNSQLADLGTAQATSRNQLARQLSLDAAGQTLSDRLGIQGAAQSGLSQLGGLDTQVHDSRNANTLNQYDRGIQRDTLLNNQTMDQAQFNLGRDQSINDARYRTESTNAGNALQASLANAGNSLRAGEANADIAGRAFNQQSQNRDFAFGLDKSRNDLGFQRAELQRGLGNDVLAGGRLQSGLADQAFGRGDAERNALRSHEGDANQYNLNRMNALSGYEGQVFGQDRQLRDEQRGERSYQNDLEQQATDRAYKQLLAEQGIYNDQFGQQQDQIRTYGQLGYGVDPTGQLNRQADGLNQSGDAAIGGAGDYLQQYAASQAQQRQQQAANAVIDRRVAPNVRQTQQYTGGRIR